MIETEADGTRVLCYEDWTAVMIKLSSMMWKLPRHPDEDEATHELGIDMLARLPRGADALLLLHDHVEELEHRPDEDEVVALGKTLIRLDREMTQLGRTARMRRRAP